MTKQEALAKELGCEVEDICKICGEEEAISEELCIGCKLAKTKLTKREETAKALDCEVEDICQTCEEEEVYSEDICIGCLEEIVQEEEDSYDQD